MSVVMEKGLEPIHDESAYSMAQQLVYELEPREIKYALLKAGCGYGGTFVHAGRGERLYHDKMLSLVGLPRNSTVAQKVEVKQLIDLLRSGVLLNITPLIHAMQDVGVLGAYETDLTMMHNPKTDPKLRHKIAESFLDRDPQSRTIKRKGQINQNEYAENDGLKAFKEVCARKRLVSGVATERRVEFHVEPSPESEAPPCQG